MTIGGMGSFAGGLAGSFLQGAQQWQRAKEGDALIEDRKADLALRTRRADREEAASENVTGGYQELAKLMGEDETPSLPEETSGAVTHPLAASGFSGAEPATGALPAAAGMTATSAVKQANDPSAFFKDPKKLKSAAQIFLKRGMPEGLNWLKQGQQAAKENLFEALGHLDSNDPEAAVKAFNSSDGSFNDVKDVVKNADGTWTATRAGGQTKTFATDSVRRSLLFPEAYFAQQQHEQKSKVDQQAVDAKTAEVASNDAYRKGMLDIKDFKAASDSDIAQGRQQLAAAKAEAAAAGPMALAKFKQENAPGLEMDKFLHDATVAGSSNPRETALANMALSMSIETRVAPDGQVVMFNKHTNDPFFTFPSVAEYKKITGFAPSQRGSPKVAPAAMPAQPRPAAAAGMTRAAPSLAQLDDSQVQALATTSPVPEVRENAKGELARRASQRASLMQRQASEEQAGQAGAVMP